MNPFVVAFQMLAQAILLAVAAILTSLMALSAFGVVIWAFQPHPAGFPDLLWWLAVFR